MIFSNLLINICFYTKCNFDFNPIIIFILFIIFVFKQISDIEVNKTQILDECLENFSAEDYIMEPGIISSLGRYLSLHFLKNKIF